jgi:dihydrofolate reductase
MKAIVCMNEHNGIGFKGGIPWKSLAYKNFVRKQVLGNGNNAVVIGRKAFKTMNYQPIFGVRNYILSRDPNIFSKVSGDVIVESNEENILFLNFIFEDVYVIGGSEIFSLLSPFVDTIHLFLIHNKNACDRFFPISLSEYHISEEKKVQEIYHSLTYYKYLK